MLAERGIDGVDGDDGATGPIGPRGPQGEPGITQDLSNYYTKSETYSQTEVNNKLSAVYRYKGSVPLYEDLPTIGNTIGDTYNVINGITPELNGMNYA